MKKIIKYFGILVVLFLITFGLYVYKIHALSVKGNELFGLRCTDVNPPLIDYKNSYLNYVECLKDLDKCSKEEFVSFVDGYITGMRKYLDEENKWIDKQQKYLNSWSVKLIQPWYIKQAGEYQLKMYEAYRDEARYFLKMTDSGLENDSLSNEYLNARDRRFEFEQKYFEFYDKAIKIEDWRKRFGSVPLPVGCTEENMTIPDTSDALDWNDEQKDFQPSTIPSESEITG